MTIVDLVMTSDTYLTSANTSANTNTLTSMGVGRYDLIENTARTLIKPDFSPIVGKIISSATLKMTPFNDYSSNARTMYAHRVLRTVNYSQTTWNVYSTGNNWGTAGCSNSTSDYDGAVVLGTATQPASPTLNSALSFTMTLDAAEIQKFNDGTYTNDGIVLFVDTQSDDLIYYASTDHATAGYRPVITVEYLTPDIDRFMMQYPMRK